MFDSNEKTLLISLTNTVGDIVITYNFNYKDDKIFGTIKAIATDVNKNNLGTISSRDGKQFSSGLYFGYGISAGDMLDKAKEGIAEIFKNVENYI